MTHIIHLTPKYAETQSGVEILLNRHNQQGWIEKPNGQTVKLIKKKK